jgi:hypothetical protein
VQLERELRTYRDRLPELVQHAGKYVVIQNGDVIDVFAAYGDALRDGYRRFGLDPFLVKQILIPEPVHFFTRVLQPARTKPAEAARENSVDSVDSV